MTAQTNKKKTFVQSHFLSFRKITNDDDSNGNNDDIDGGTDTANSSKEYLLSSSKRFPS